MKKLLTSLLRRLTANPSTQDPEPASSPQAPAPVQEVSVSLAKTPLAPVTSISSSMPAKKSFVHPQQTVLKSNEAQSINSLDFITRQELRGELDLLRRLIESRK